MISTLLTSLRGKCIIAPLKSCFIINWSTNSWGANCRSLEIGAKIPAKIARLKIARRSVMFFACGMERYWKPMRYVFMGELTAFLVWKKERFLWPPGHELCTLMAISLTDRAETLSWYRNSITKSTLNFEDQKSHSHSKLTVNVIQTRIMNLNHALSANAIGLLLKKIMWRLALATIKH